MTIDIKEAKEAWEDRLMAMPGVMAVGIALGKDRQPCIQVTLERSGPGRAEEIPKEIEGHPVEIKVRGTFRAL